MTVPICPGDAGRICSVIFPWFAVDHDQSSFSSVLSRDRIDVKSLWYWGSTSMVGCQISAQKERDHHQVANAVVVKVGGNENMQQAILAVGIGPHRPDPSGLAGSTIDDEHAAVAVRLRHRSGIRNDKLGSAVAIEVDHEWPIDREHLLNRSLGPEVDRRDPQISSVVQRERGQRPLSGRLAPTHRQHFGIAVTIEVRILDRLSGLTITADDGLAGPLD
jgi:hypothetical protein